MDTPETDDTAPVLCVYDYPETDAARKLRIAAGLPTPTYSFMCSRYVKPTQPTQEEK